MRVTQGMIAKNSLRFIGSSYDKLDRLQQQVSTGKKITKASDDPVVAMKGMQYRTQLAQVNQYQRNVSQGFTWLENSESSVNSETDIMGKIRDLMVQAKSDSNGETELKAIGTEIGQLKKQLVSVANTQVNGRYLFNGTNSDVPPITENADGTYTYNYENYTGASDVNINISNGAVLKVNSDPNSAFGGVAQNGDNIFEFLNSLEASLSKGTLSEADSNQILSDIDGFTDKMNAEKSNIGARTNRLELIQTRLESQAATAEKVLSDNEDVEMEDVIVDYLSQQTVHRAALSVNANIIQPSLIDFLK
ncbi:MULTISPECIES: flagellar hook-associated protein FlgL [Bacillus]|uniref:flagellar hook-associated protein FlgL n=1 Tax=Bacillus TaxID=1386 RepID=UPI0006A8631B|nr:MULTISPECIES: flagellar hook-associated protein FlgL [Bacillus]MDX8368616.1 flagellar hook-associated protein FlgL [Bacillus velezensis]MDY7905482.1 flagellar hook-associated protein FlgL [Bacillus sp. AG1]MEC1940688.1 flagellar hook-associated protein FlgL [Bacillus velezensis]NRS34553.1 flagellar hook-associated protein FlgL [Bacillus velezensis]NRS44143.1 flagellar hook-associated protein FlgL [Bacillus velezensis]